MIQKFKSFLGGLMPVGLAGAFLAVIVSIGERKPGGPLQSLAALIAFMLIGWLLGVAILGLIRLFRVAPWAYPFVGMLCGPFVAALFMNSGNTNKDAAGMLLLFAALGALAGLIECARISLARREERERAS